MTCHPAGGERADRGLNLGKMRSLEIEMQVAEGHRETVPDWVHGIFLFLRVSSPNRGCSGTDRGSVHSDSHWK